MQGSDDETFTPEEAAYFNSGGQSSPIAADPAAPSSPDAGGDTSSGGAGAAGAPRPGDAGSDDGAEPGEVELAADGRVRDAKTGRYVPLPVLQREREAAKALKAENAQLRANWDKIAEKLSRAIAPPAPAAVAEQKPAEPPALINPREDLIGAIEQERQARLDLEKRQQETAAQTEARLENERMQRTFERSVSEFGQKSPDFEDAFKHLQTARANQLARFAQYRGEDGNPDPQKIQAQIIADARGIIENAVRGGRSPAEELYTWAKDYGYAPKSATPAPREQEKTPAQLAVEQVTEGRQASKTLTNAGGTSSSGLTFDEYLAMDEAVIAAKAASDPSFKAEVERLLGRR